MTDYDTSRPAGRAFSEGTVDVAGWAIRYWEHGSGEPLVYVHPAGGPLITIATELLAKEFRVIAIEFPGFGDEINERTEDTKAAAEIVLAFAKALGLERFNLWGTSMGGAIAAWAAVIGGEQLNRVILESPSIFRPDRKSPGEMAPEEFFRAFHAHPERKYVTPHDPERMARNWPLIERLVGPLYDEALAAALPAVEVPMLALFGEKDGLFGTEPGAELKRINPKAQFTIVYDAAHEIAGDRPEAFAAYVTDFIRRGNVFVVQDRSTLLYA